MQLAVNDVSDAGIAGVELPGQQQVGQLVVQFPLDGAPQWARAELRLEAAVGQPVQRRPLSVLAGGLFGLRLGPPLHETGCPGVERFECRSKVPLCLFTFGVQACGFEDSPVA